MAEKWIAVFEIDDWCSPEVIVEDLTNRKTDLRLVSVRKTQDSSTRAHACAECEYVHLPIDKSAAVVG